MRILALALSADGGGTTVSTVTVLRVAWTSNGLRGRLAGLHALPIPSYANHSA
jgi:hypothetical protein